MYQLIRFDRGSVAPARDLAELHADLLPTSPIVKLGIPFLEHFYYAVLPSAGALFGTLARVDGDAAGFIVATDDSASFARNAVRGRRFTAARAVVSSFLRSPGRIEAAGEILRLAFAKTSGATGDAEEKFSPWALEESFENPVS